MSKQRKQTYPGVGLPNARYSEEKGGWSQLIEVAAGSCHTVQFINTQQPLSDSPLRTCQMENSILQRFQQVLREIHEEQKADIDKEDSDKDKDKEKPDESSSSSESETCEAAEKPKKRKMIEKMKSVPNQPIVLDSGDELNEEELSKDVDKMMMDLEGELPRDAEEPLSNQEATLERTTQSASTAKPIWKKNLKALTQTAKLGDNIKTELKAKQVPPATAMNRTEEDEKFIKSLQELLEKDKQKFAMKMGGKSKKARLAGREKQLAGGKVVETEQNRLKENIMNQISQHNDNVRKLDKAPSKDSQAERQGHQKYKNSYQVELEPTPNERNKMEKVHTYMEKMQNSKTEKIYFQPSRNTDEKKLQGARKLEYPSLAHISSLTQYQPQPAHKHSQFHENRMSDDEFDAKTAKKSTKAAHPQPKQTPPQPPLPQATFSPSFIQSFLTRRQNSHKIDLGVCSLAELVDQAHGSGVISNELYFEFVNSYNDESLCKFIHCFADDELGSWNYSTHKISIADHRRIAELLVRLSPDKYTLLHPQALNHSINEFLLRIYELPPEDYQIMMGCIDGYAKYSWWKPIRVKYEHLLRDTPQGGLRVEAGKVNEKKAVAKEAPLKKPKTTNFPRPANSKKNAKNVSPDGSSGKSDSSSQLSPEEQINASHQKRKLFSGSSLAKPQKVPTPSSSRRAQPPSGSSDRLSRK